jgi:hypothetical protein
VKERVGSRSKRTENVIKENLEEAKVPGLLHFKFENG